MFEKIIWPIVSGVISTFVANWVAGAWQGLSVRDRWLISVAFGVGVAVAVLVISSRRSRAKSPQGKTDKRKEAFTANKPKGSMRAEGVTLEGYDGAFNDNEPGEDLVVKDTVVRASDE
jgi:hypothetical protein